MGQKVNPIGLRLGINRTWESRWYANTAEYGDLLHQDLAIRNFLFEELKNASVARMTSRSCVKKLRKWSTAKSLSI